VQVNTNLSSTAFGFNTSAQGSASTAVGNSTVAAGDAATALGRGTSAGGAASLASGRESVASGANSTALGFQTTASGAQATSLGQSTTAGGFNSFAGGTQARANHDGSFVWTDYNYADFASTATNQFLIRAAAGVGINTNNPSGAALAVHGNVKVNGSIGSPGSAPLELYVSNQRGLRLELGTFFPDTVNVVAGSSHNSVAAGIYGATIGGGGGGMFFGSAANHVGGDSATVSGGAANIIQNNADGATLSGGTINTIETGANNAVIGGGHRNVIQAQASFSTISGGEGNRINTRSANIGGGYANAIETNAHYATIGGGHLNALQPGAEFATIPGGRENSATNYAFAAGRRAKANHTGAFVWGDSSDSDFASTGQNQFLIRAAGGVGINTTAPQAPLHVWGRGIVNGSDFWDVNSTEGDFRVGSATHRFKIGVAQGGGGAGDVWMRAHGGTGRMFVKTPGGTTFFSNEGQTAGVSMAPGGGAWTSVSDRNAKENLRPVNTAEVLAKVAALPLSTWNYKSQAAHIQHLGPMAQDFKAAFGLGETDTGITTVDADGVALAAIQGLNAVVKEKDAKIARLEQRLSDLENLVKALVGKAASEGGLGVRPTSPSP
jgi:hypothetical protein